MGSITPPRCSVDGFAESPDLCERAFAQPIVVMLQVFDHGLEVAHSRPQSSGLQDETIIPINSLTQKRLCHTNSDKYPPRVRRAMDKHIADASGRERSGGTPRVSSTSRQVNARD